MPDQPSATLGSTELDFAWPVTVTPPERTLTVSANALSTTPVQVTDYISNFGVVSGTAIVKGVASGGETAADNCLRLVANIVAEVASDTNLLALHWGDSNDVYSYTIVKSPPPAITYDAPFGRAAVAFVYVELLYSSTTDPRG